MPASRVDDLPTLIRGDLLAPAPPVNGKDIELKVGRKKCRPVPIPPASTTAGVIAGEPFPTEEPSFGTDSDTPPPVVAMIATTVRIKSPLVCKHIKHTLRDTPTITVRVPVTSCVTANLGAVDTTVYGTTDTSDDHSLYAPSVAPPTTINSPIESTINNVVVVPVPLSVSLPLN